MYFAVKFTRASPSSLNFSDLILLFLEYLRSYFSLCMDSLLNKKRILAHYTYLK